MKVRKKHLIIETKPEFWFSMGYKRFEMNISFKEIALPFSFTIGVGAYSFRVFCVDFLLWRNDNRFEIFETY